MTRAVPRHLALTIWLSTLTATAWAQVPLEYAREDPTKIQSAETCGECHVSEYEVWKRTPHATGFKSLHRTEAAEVIADRMGFRLMKRDSPCLLCHFTPTVQREQLRAISGVSCESCHGAAQDWIDVHNDYGGKGVTFANETPEHRQTRIAQSLAGGMRRPTDLYDVAASCYGCHTVPNERLVNVGRHSIGSSGFELVKFQEEIRHNFLESFKTGDGTQNAERPPERKRLMYVAGRALELEHALRGVAAATEKGVYLKAMQRRVRDSLTEVRAIAVRGEVTEMDEAVALVRDVDVKLGNREALLAAAERIGAVTKRFLTGQDGTQLASLDGLVLGTEDSGFLDDLEDELEDDTAIATTDPTTPAPGSPTANADPGAGAAAGGTATAATSPTAAVPSDAIPATGEIKTRIRPVSQFATLAGDACQKCHGDQHAWWYDDPHYAAIEPFLERQQKNAQIARLYGISPSRMARGNVVCMDCHGTVVTGREKREVADGVSCQGCHGPAKEFFEPHQEGEKSQGLSRPGYVKALRLGMRELKSLDTRADTCSGCHYITDSRLISSGHPSGLDFDYAAGMEKIRHWTSPQESKPTLTAAFTKALSVRGSVPKVRLARLATVTTSASGPAGAAAASGAEPATAGEISSRQARRPFRRTADNVPRARPVDRRALPSADDLVHPDLPPFPQIDESTSIEDVLRLLKERLELLYRATRKEP